MSALYVMIYQFHGFINQIISVRNAFRELSSKPKTAKRIHLTTRDSILGKNIRHPVLDDTKLLTLPPADDRAFDVLSNVPQMYHSR
jgi:hypothetical protein